MQPTSSRNTTFGRATRDVLEHLSRRSGIATWALCRVDRDVSYTLAVADPRGEIRMHEVIPAPIRRGSDNWVSVPVTFPDGRPFGELVGFDSTERLESIDAVTPLLHVFASLLGALADGEMTLTSERRAKDVAGGELDQLTGLGTRQAWEHRLRVEEHFCREFGEPAAIVVIELVDLKRYNELHGHAAGDEQLRITGNAVREELGSHGFGARLTGDHFAVLLIGLSDADVDSMVERIRHALTEVGTASAVGLAHRRPETGFGGAMAAAEADIRSMGRAVVTAGPDEATEFVEALESGAVKAYFQPIVNLSSGAVVAIEALARWHSLDGVREPERFMPILQQAGLLGALFDRILDDGMARLSEFRHLVPNLQLTVNIEFDTTPGHALLESIQEHLSKHGLPPQALVLELSERKALKLAPERRQELVLVHNIGVKLMLDDFGGGLDSMETLTTLPVSGVKLHRRLTAQVANGDRESSIVKAMVSLAADSGLTMVAAGIETQQQCDRLMSIGCQLGQGYLFALPQPADSLAILLSASLVSTF